MICALALHLYKKDRKISSLYVLGNIQEEPGKKFEIFTNTYRSRSIMDFIILQNEHAENADMKMQRSFGQVQVWPMSRRVS